MSDNKATDTKGPEKFSPFAGCLIMIILGFLVIGVILFTWQSYGQVKATVKGFTEESPQEVFLVNVTGKESSQLALSNKLSGFKQAVVNREEASLSLTADELNLAIASYEILEPNRQKIFIKNISKQGIEATISYPVNYNVLSNQKRYLNGNASIIPEMTGGALFPTVKKIATPLGDDIPEQFKGFITETMLHPIRNDEELGRLMKRISSVEIGEDSIILKAQPDFVAAGEVPDDTKPIVNRFMKGFGIVAVGFLLIVSLIILISRRKAPNTI